MNDMPQILGQKVKVQGHSGIRYDELCGRKQQPWMACVDLEFASVVSNKLQLLKQQRRRTGISKKHSHSGYCNMEDILNQKLPN